MGVSVPLASASAPTFAPLRLHSRTRLLAPCDCLLFASAALHSHRPRPARAPFCASHCLAHRFSACARQCALLVQGPRVFLKRCKPARAALSPPTS
eukprot:3731905-Pleurochrysis_carterae.AAC.2